MRVLTKPRHDATSFNSSAHIEFPQLLELTQKLCVLEVSGFTQPTDRRRKCKGRSIYLSIDRCIDRKLLYCIESVPVPGVELNSKGIFSQRYTVYGEQRIVAAFQTKGCREW